MVLINKPAAVDVLFERRPSFILEFFKMDLELGKDFMTKEKYTINPTRTREIAVEKELNTAGMSSKKPKKIKTRIVEIDEPSYEAESQEKIQIDALYKLFNSKIKSSTTWLLPQIPDRIGNDFLLKKLLIEFKEQQNSYQNLVQSTQARWKACSIYPDYYDHLSKLLNENIKNVTNLNTTLESLYFAIIERFNLISFKEITHIKEAKNKLISSLDGFILSLFVLQFNPMIYSQADRFKEVAIYLIKELKERLTDNILKLNSSAAKTLTSYLLDHIGPNLIKLDEVNILTYLLFQGVADFSSYEGFPDLLEIEHQFLAFYDLAARLDLSPIHYIKKYELLSCSYIDQQNQIIKISENLLLALNRCSSQLVEMRALFIGVEDELFFEFKETDLLTSEIQKMIAQVLDTKQAPKQLPSQLEHLLEATRVQEETLKKLASLEQQADFIAVKTQQYIRKLEALYNRELFYLINLLKDTITITKSALELQKQPHHMQEINKASLLVSHLMTAQPKINLNSIKTQTHHKATQLLDYVEEIKANLKIEWSKRIFSLLSKKMERISLKKDTPINIILMEINTYNEPYQSEKLSSMNPIQGVLNEVTKQCNQGISNLIYHFSSLIKISGNEINQWINTSTHLYHKIRDNILMRDVIENKAIILEKRLHCKQYLACLAIIKVIDREFINILQMHVDKIIIQERAVTINNIAKDPMLLLDEKNELSPQISVLFQSFNPLLIKLFTISKEIRQLNSKYISDDLTLCTEDQYIPQLLGIVIDHIDKDGKDLYSKGISTSDLFIEWLHINVYKPLLNYYAPKEAPFYFSERSNSKIPNAAFFQSTLNTPGNANESLGSVVRYS